METGIIASCSQLKPYKISNIPTEAELKILHILQLWESAGGELVGAVPVAELGTVTDIRQEGGGDGLSNIVLVRFIVRGITVCQGHHLRSHMVVNRTPLTIIFWVNILPNFCNLFWWGVTPTWLERIWKDFIVMPCQSVGDVVKLTFLALYIYWFSGDSGELTMEWQETSCSGSNRILAG